VRNFLAKNAASQAFSDMAATHHSNLDDSFYQPADAFFAANSKVGLTYDDITLATLYSEILPRNTQLDTTLAEGLRLNIPAISADMDTVTESRMAIAMALNGGLGLIHYNMPEREQLSQVSRVKYHVQGLIQDPIKVAPEQLIGDVLELIEQKKFVGSSYLFEKQHWVHDVEIEYAVSTHTDHTEIRVPHHDCVGSAPTISSEEARCHKVHIRLERRFKSVFPSLERGQNRGIVRRQSVSSGSVGVAELPLIDKLSHLRLAHDELSAPLDLFVIVRVAVGKGVSGIVLPLDDLKELRFQVIADAHFVPSASELIHPHA